MVMRHRRETVSEQPSGLRLARLWYLVGALMLLLVAVASLLPAPPDVGVDDKLSHGVTYFVLGGWFGLLAANRRALAASVLGLLVYGIVLEWLQGLGGYRYAEWGDVLANCCGTTAGAMLYFTPLARGFGSLDKRLDGLWRG